MENYYPPSALLLPLAALSLASCGNQKKEEFNFGKYKGMSVAEVLKKDPGYYSWILNSDFTLNTKAALTKIRLREMSNLITK